MDVSQPSLLQGFDVSRPAPGGPRLAEHLPVARVLLETPVPHLDQLYDYAVTAELDEQAVAGTRVRVRFGGQELGGFITERRAETDAGVKLQPLHKVVSPEPVLSAHVLALCQAVAARYAGVVSDVVRAAVPPRMARVEKEERPAWGEPAPAPEATAESLAAYDGGTAFLGELAGGAAPRAVITLAPNVPAPQPAGNGGGAAWLQAIASAVAAAVAAGRGAVVVAPDQRDVDRLCEFFDAVFGATAYARLTADDGATARYRNFLAVSRGDVRIAVGTRSAAFAPVADLGLAVLWEDHDTSHAEPRSPYQHAREILLLRSELEGCGLLIAGWSRSPEAHRLVLTGWARELKLPRPVLRRRAPRVLATSDSYEVERDPTLHAARLPRAAWQAAHDGLARGPVLVQVARTGFIPALRCERCREPARCLDCNGPLELGSREAAPRCRWCGTFAHGWACLSCGFQRLRASSIGADRTAEELGRAFPQARVVSATGANPRASVSGSGVLVVATPGAEPVAVDGYAAVLLLDGDRMLARDSLRTAEEVLHRWFAAAALGRARDDGGVVVATAAESEVLRAFVRWDAPGFAERELVERRELGLPPAVRSAVVTGPSAAADAFVGALELPAEVRRIGPVILEEEETVKHRWLLFFRHADGTAVTGRLREAKAVSSANREPIVNVRVDGDTQL
ncbi:primosomal protein N' [Zhihengliuella halotolerans]|uniref:Probable replication restart protein PriA n=1 Tax=Zhihengliuella halotolerans TaxID=370736 RepID=A0A4Q8ABD9_9MICC|nr:primosomal protein N' [Zhihengliuella halotolerans]RZU61344.1 replication restart DNA helicase PriA [Zhihengliuella halotolerans]